MIRLLTCVRRRALFWPMAFAAAMLISGAPVHGQSTDKSAEIAEIVSHVRETGKSDNKKFVYAFFAKALALGNAEIPGVNRRGVAFGDDQRVVLLDFLVRQPRTR